MRKSQVAVCQTAQLVQEQVAKLMTARAQLEGHRAALHHHLSTITNLLANSKHQKQQQQPPTKSLGVTINSNNINTSSFGAVVNMNPSVSLGHYSVTLPSGISATENNNSGIYSSSINQKSNSNVINGAVSISNSSSVIASSIPIKAGHGISSSVVVSGTSSVPIMSTITSTSASLPFLQQGFSSPILVNPTSIMTTTIGSGKFPVMSNPTSNFITPNTSNNKSVTILSPSTTTTSWSGLPTTYLSSTNMSHPVENKDGIFYPHHIKKEPSHHVVVTTINGNNKSVVNKSIYSSHSSSKTSSSSIRHHGSHRNLKSPAQSHGNSNLNKINGSTSSSTAHNIYKPMQITSHSGVLPPGKLIGKVSTDSSTSAFTPPVPSVGTSSSGISSHIVGLQPSQSGLAAQKGMSSIHSSINHSANKTGKSPHKPQIGFTPYAKTSPGKAQNWVPN